MLVCAYVGRWLVRYLKSGGSIAGVKYSRFTSSTVTNLTYKACGVLRQRGDVK